MFKGARGVRRRLIRSSEGGFVSNEELAIVVLGGLTPDSMTSRFKVQQE
jgi:hypothetical protein